MVLVFSWRLLLDRLPFCEKLHKRLVQVQNLEVSCYFCYMRKETTQDLFFTCYETIQIWYRIFKWLGVDIVLPHQEINYLYIWPIWFAYSWKEMPQMEPFATCWCIWKIRNSITFWKRLFDGAKLLEDIKFTSWQWFLYKNKSVIFFSYGALTPCFICIYIVRCFYELLFGMYDATLLCIVNKHFLIV